MARRREITSAPAFEGLEPLPKQAGGDPAIARIIGEFQRAHLARFGCKPLRPEYGRFAKELKEMLAAADETELFDLLADFFAVPADPRVERTQYRPMDFVRLAQYLRLRRRGACASDARTLDNLDAVARATGRR